MKKVNKKVKTVSPSCNRAVEQWVTIWISKNHTSAADDLAIKIVEMAETLGEPPLNPAHLMYHLN